MGGGAPGTVQLASPGAALLCVLSVFGAPWPSIRPLILFWSPHSTFHLARPLMQRHHQPAGGGGPRQTSEHREAASRPVAAVEQVEGGELAGLRPPARLFDVDAVHAESEVLRIQVCRVRRPEYGCLD